MSLDYSRSRDTWVKNNFCIGYGVNISLSMLLLGFITELIKKWFMIWRASTWEVAHGYRLEQLLHFFRPLTPSREHP